MTLSYKLEDSLYKLYDGDKQLFTPHNSPVVTTSEALAQRLVMDAERFNGDFMSPWSTLCLHFGACDIHAMDKDIREQGLQEFIENVIYNDPFLMFRQPSPVRNAYEAYFGNTVSQMLLEAEDHILSTFINVNGGYGSMMLAYYIYSDIVSEDHDMIEQTQAEFVKEFREFCKEEGYNIRQKLLTKKTLEQLVDTLTFYMSMQKVF